MPLGLRLVTLLVVAAAALGGASRALACGGSSGYTYAGLASSSHAAGISARVTAVPGFDVVTGHVAAWVGLGGPRQGPGGTDEWLQVGLSSFPGSPGNDVYYELALPSRHPTYQRVAANIPFGKTVRVAVLEVRHRPNWWRVWLDRRPVSKPIWLPQSHHRWSPIVTAESWDGGGGACNGFLYRFSRIATAFVPGGRWHPLRQDYTIDSPTTRVRRSRTRASFIAAEGAAAIRKLRSLVP